MKRSARRDPNYAFGQAMLTLRSAMGLTQSGLAKLLGVSRYALGDWEAGENYPKVEHLKHFITLAVQGKAFPAGHEAEEIRALWKLARQKVLLDERWLASLLIPSPTPVQETQASPVHITSHPPKKLPHTAGERDRTPAFPLPLTPFIGRVDEQAEIARILADPACHLLTLLGPGGIGKTRLALQVAAGQGSAFADGVIVVLLAAITTRDQLVSAIADALPSFTGQIHSARALLDYLRDRDMLLVLDNFEHLLEAVDLVNDLVENAPRVKLLITSRERLNLRSEWLFDVTGLAYPALDGRDQPSEALTDYSAVQLFVQRAAQVQPQFPFTDANLTTISRICQHLAGMPLAIELAAAGTRLLKLGDIEQQIRSNLDILATTLRDVPARHRSLRAAFDQSWNGLDEQERALFSRLAVFRGGCTLDAAVQIAGAALPVLMALTDKSLVRQVEAAPEAEADSASSLDMRFYMLEPLREYAQEKLAARSEVDAIHRAHAIYYLALADAAANQWDTPTADEAIAQLDADHDNMRAVLQWASAGGDINAGLRLGGSLRKFWQRRGYFTEGRAWLETLLALDQDTSDPAAIAARADGMNTAAWLASDQNDYVQAAGFFRHSLELRRALGEAGDERRLLSTAARQARADGHFQRATALLEDALARDRALGDRGSLTTGGLGLSLYDLGLTLREQGEFERATALFEEAISLHEELGDREGMSVGLLGLSDIARDLGNSEDVRRYGEQCLAYFRELNIQWAIGFALNNLALASYMDGDLAQAQAHSTESVALFRAMQAEGSLAEVLITYGAVSLALGDIIGAHEALSQSLQIAQRVGPRLLVASALEGQASVLVQMGDAALAVGLLAEASERRAAMGTPVRPVDQPALERTLAAARAALGEAAFTALWTKTPPEPTPPEQPEKAPALPTPPPATQKSRLDWSGALTVPSFYGRDRELALLTEWMVGERCRIVSVVGIGGIGKSALAVSQMHGVAAHFEFVIWRSLRDAPTCEALLDDCLQVLTAQSPVQTPASLEQHIDLLLDHIRAHRVLLVLDNLETLMEEGANVGDMRSGYEGYGRLLRRIAETHHQGCVLLTSREKVADLVSLEGSRAPVRTLRLTQLDGDSCERLLAEKDVSGSGADKAKLIEAYAGNPLALKIVAQTIAELFDGEITPFLEHGEVIFGGVRRLLNEQFSRLSPLERDVMIWLAILREPTTLTNLRKALVRPTASAGLLEAIESLSRRSLIELGQTRGSFTLQSVVQEYVTARLIAEVSGEIERGQLDRLVKYGLELAHTREYVRQIEVRLIATPVLERLRSIYSPQARLEEHLLSLLKGLSALSEGDQGCAPSNLVVLLRLLRGNLRGVDLSHLVLRDLYLQDVHMQDARLVNATMQEGVFTEAFDALTAVAASPTGEHWAASSRRGELRIWTAGILRHMWRGHITTSWTLTFSPDGRFLVSGSNDGALKLWDVASGQLVWVVREESDVSRLSFSPDGRFLASAVDNAHVSLRDAATGTLLQTLPHPDHVATVAWSADGQRLASGDVKGIVRLWTVHPAEPATLLQTLTDHTNCADGVAFAPDGRTVASASWDGTVKLWEVPSGQLLHTLTGHTDRVGRVAWSADGRMVASGSADQSILLWDVDQGSYRAALRGHSSHIYELDFTPDSRSLLSSSRDGSLRVWDVASAQCIRIIHGYAASIYDVDWSPDSRRLASGGTDLVVTLWDAETGTPLQTLQEHASVICSVGWSPEGRWLASSETEYGIRLWDVSAGTDFRFLRPPDNSGGYMYRLAWNPDGRRLAGGSHQHGVIIWDVERREETRIGGDLPTYFPLLAWSPDGTRLAGGGVDGGVYIWNVADNALEQHLSGHDNRIISLAWSPDGTHLASGARGAEGGELFVWDTQRGECSHNLVGHVSAVVALAWDSTGEWLISGSGQGTLRWWELRSGECVWVRPAHNGAVQALRRSPDGAKLATCGDDGAIMLWDIPSAEHLQTLRRDRPYERLDITGIRGLTDAQKEMLHALGAVEDGYAPSSPHP